MRSDVSQPPFLAPGFLLGTEFEKALRGKAVKKGWNHDLVTSSNSSIAGCLLYDQQAPRVEEYDCSATEPEKSHSLVSWML